MCGPAEVVSIDRDEFEMLDVTHLAALAVFVAGAVVVVMIGRRRRDVEGPDWFARGMAIVLAGLAVPWQAVQLTPGEWDLGSSLPLHLSNVAWFVIFAALWTRRQPLAVWSFLWGITLSTQAMLTPDLASPFPTVGFFAFWVLHWITAWAGIYLVWGLGIRPTWRAYWITVGATLGWMVSVFTFNLIAGTNYGYLNEKPPLGSVLDHFPAWPYYLVVLIVLVAGGWALIVAAFRPWREAEGAGSGPSPR